MEENKLELNEKLYSFDGVIGRYGYFYNAVIICALNFLALLPYTMYICYHAQDMTQLFGGREVFSTFPLLLQIWTLVATAGVCTLSLSNIYRRLNDIVGYENNNLNINLLILSAVASFGFLLFPFGIASLCMLFSFVFGLVLLFKKGKITSLMPYDYKKEFNWGAYFGTWIWGLFNNSYIPLWHLLLFLTPLGWYFRLICGLKGNEWAYKNKKYDDVKLFNKSQEKQAFIFIILSLVLWPLFIIGVIAIFVALVFLIGYTNGMDTVSDKEPVAIESKQQVEVKKESTFDKMMNGLASVYFEKYEITEDENKFYVTPETWKSSDFKDKTDMMKMASTIAANERNKKERQKKSENREYYSKSTEMERTKIYSTGTNQLLAEFNMKESDLSGSFMDIMKSALKAFKFYNIED